MSALSRRDALKGFAGIAGLAAMPGLARAQEAQAWTLGFADAPAQGYGPETLQLVHGRAPAGLSGTLFRNGPAHFRYPDGTAATHWFDGDGLIRRFRIEEGRATHSARFVDTEKRRVEAAVGTSVMPGFGTPGRADAPVSSADSTNPANTSVLPVNGQIWALWEAGSPYRINPETLASEGPHALREDLAHMPFLAHPKVEPSGRIWNIGSGGRSCFIWQLSPTGEVERAEVITLPRPDYIHDWAITERHLLILLQPWTMTSSRPPFVETLLWNPNEAFQVLVIDKADWSNQRVFEAPAMSFFHTGDAFEEQDGTIRVDLCASPDPFWTTTAARTMLLGRHEPMGYGPRLVQLALRPDGSTSLIETGVQGEFPQTDKRRQGQRRALTVLASDTPNGRPLESAVTVWDWEAGRGERFSFGPDHLVEEMLLVPYGPDERDNWLIGTTLNLAARATELHVLNARRIADGPIATWRSAHAAPLGFHGCWM